MQDRKRQPGSVGFAIVFLLASVVLLSQIGGQTKFSSSGQLFAQPRFWPGVAVLGMVIFGLGHLLKELRQARSLEPFEVRLWLSAVEYAVWFMAYVWSVPIIGYLLATVVFTVSLAFRQGYRGHRMLLLACLLGFVIVLVFKTGLAVKIPGGELYEYLPDGLRNFMIVNF